MFYTRYSTAGHLERFRFITTVELTDQKYQNASDPQTGAAHACLMYMYHLEYHKILVNNLVENINDFPSPWSVSQKPGWSKGVTKMCRLLKADIDKVHNEARKIRAMV